MPYRLSTLAERDLEEIWSYVAEDAGPTRADRLVDAIVDRFDLLVEQPRMGRSRPEFGEGVRSFVVENYVIYYRHDGDLLIARVLQELDLNASVPGRGWVMVRGALTRDGILTALGSGDFYASTGVTLQDVRATPTSYTVDVEITMESNPPTPRRNRVMFVGKGGRELGVSYDNPATYAITGSEGYVRGRIEDSRGRRARTQPVFVPGGR